MPQRIFFLNGFQVAPPFVTGGLYAIILARFSDRTMKRAPFMILSCLVCIVGLAMTGFSHKNAVRYAGVFITVCGSSANVPGVLAYVSVSLAEER